MTTALTAIEREMATSYVLVHSRLINAALRKEDFVTARDEARGVVATLERLIETTTPPAERSAP